MSRKQNKIIRRRLAGSYLSSVISISLVLLLVGAASFVIFNASAVGAYFREHLHVTVVLKKDTPAVQAVAYQRKIEAEPFVKATHYVSVQEGEKEMREMLGEDFLDVFETSPVPSSVEVTVRAAWMNPDSLLVVHKRLSDSPIVDEVDCNIPLVESMSLGFGKAGLAVLLVVALLMVISVALIANTVRLGLYANRFTIHTMQLVGASRRFIARPYVRRTVVQGLVGALIALALIALAVYLVWKSHPDIYEIFTVRAFAGTAAAVIVFGVMLCWLCSNAVVSRIVKLDNDELYG
ncbi:MAG: permease-like cell division protein FtsX [Bacteroidales bacterium]|nr:permease-like cell division protein FtsX [Bacteroidales bacterium]